MTRLQRQERAIVLNLKAGKDPFDGFSKDDREDYIETVRIMNDVREESEKQLKERETLNKDSVATSWDGVFTEVRSENGFNLSFAIRVF